MKITQLIIVLVTLFIAVVNAQRPITAVDLHSLRRLSGATVSPDGRWIAYSVRNWDYPATNKTSTNIEIVDVRSLQVMQITPPNPGVSDSNPMFSPDGSVLAFLSTRSGSSQIWATTLTNPSGVKQVTFYPVDITSFKWPKAGGILVFTADVYIDCLDLYCTATRDAAVAARGPNTGFVYDQLFVRHWDVWTTGKHSHIFVQRITYLSQQITLNGQPKDVMFKMQAESPIAPFGGPEQYDISPDGTEIVFNADYVNNSSQAWTTGWKIFTVPVQGAGSAPFWLTSHTSARTQNPLYSPDGSCIAYLAMDRPGLESDRLHIEVFNKTSGQIYQVTNMWDRSVADYSWRDHISFFITATNDGVNMLFSAYAYPSAQVTVEINDLYGNSAPIVIPGTKSGYFLVRDSFTDTADVWTFVYNSGVQYLQQITFTNKGISSTFGFSQPEIFHFNHNNTVIQGWLFKPFNFDPSRRYPIAHLIHGGPEGAWETSFSYRWNPQLWAARGYAVVLINPAGSTGQGQAFTDAVRNNWGGAPFQQLMAGMDYIINQVPWVDPSRQHACGASYGGYMINWINGNTNRYRSLVCHDGVYDTMAMYGGTEELWFPESEYCPVDKRGCQPWQPGFAVGFEQWNPRNFVQNWRTPTLVVHGGHDFRIPLSEGLSAFTALQRKGIPSKFLYFPMENHWVLNSLNSVMWYDNVLGWLDKWNK